MAGTTLSTLRVVLQADIDKYKKDMAQASKETEKFGSTAARSSKLVSAVTMAGVAGVAYAAKRFVSDLYNAYAEAEVAQKKLNQVLISTKGAAEMSADSLNLLAKQLQLNTIYDDDAVVAAEALMLTFTKVGRETFPRAIEAAMNMSTALGQDLKGSVTQLGKALQDPILGITALRRVGVNFNQEQSDLIKNLVEENKLMEAQAYILDELQTEFGGQARAMAEGTGILQQYKNSQSEWKEAMAADLVPTINDVIAAMTELNYIMAQSVGGTGEESIFTMWFKGPFDKTVFRAFADWNKDRREEELAAEKYAADLAEIERQAGYAVKTLRDFAMISEKAFVGPPDESMFGQTPPGGFTGPIQFPAYESARRADLMKTAIPGGVWSDVWKGQSDAIKPLLKDYGAIAYGMDQIEKEYFEVNEVVLISADNYREWADQAQYATDLAMGGLEDLYSSLKRGESFWDALGAASTRFAETVISNWLRMRFYGVALNWVSGGVAAAGGSNTSGGSYNTNPSLDWNLQSTGNVTVNVSSAGMPVDVTSASTSTGADGGQVINLMVESALGSMAANGKLDKVFHMYGGRRQGVRR